MVKTFASTGSEIEQGTAFFYKRDSKWIYLVTNWHILTGRSPLEPKKSRTGAVPVLVQFKLHKRLNSNHFSISQKVEISIDINDEAGEKPIWLEHPDFRHRVDIGVIRIKNDGELSSKAIFEILHEAPDIEPNYVVEPMADAFVIGYPWGYSSGDGVGPLYKRGSVASDPRLNQGELPRFLIDCRTASGMSGAPVLVSRSGIWAPSGKVDSTTVIGTVTNFAGVYSGRLDGNSSNDAISELGIVWKKDALDKVISSGASGTKFSEL